MDPTQPAHVQPLGIESIKGQEREDRLAALEASVAGGVADAEAGHVKSASDVFDRLENKYMTAAIRPG